MRRASSRLAPFIMLAAALWLGGMLWESAETITDLFRTIRPERLATATVLILLSLLTNGLIYALILRHASGVRIPFSRVLRIYFPSQIAKYLPGKVWGIIYPAERMAASVHPLHTWQANVEAIFWSMAQAVMVTVWLISWQWGGGIGLLAGIGTLCALLVPAIRRGWVARTITGITGRLFPGITGRAGTPTGKGSMCLLILLLLDTVLYITAWRNMLPAGSDLGEAWTMASAYLLAWSAGVLVFIVPNGAFVREAGFVAVGTLFGAPRDQLLFYAALARALFMAADIAAALLALAAARIIPATSPTPVPHERSLSERPAISAQEHRPSPPAT
ncbi:MAG: hypothetical protein D6682_03485 [Zetaproteobacteria bacterium]|nr:MAG: hypothetical protein D6682_03485 [Zetaproteobacteria bacterium]